MSPAIQAGAMIVPVSVELIVGAATEPYVAVIWCITVKHPVWGVMNIKTFDADHLLSRS